MLNNRWQSIVVWVLLCAVGSAVATLFSPKEFEYKGTEAELTMKHDSTLVISGTVNLSGGSSEYFLLLGDQGRKIESRYVEQRPGDEENYHSVEESDVGPGKYHLHIGDEVTISLKAEKASIATVVRSFDEMFDDYITIVVLTLIVTLLGVWWIMEHTKPKKEE